MSASHRKIDDLESAVVEFLKNKFPVQKMDPEAE